MIMSDFKKLISFRCSEAVMSNHVMIQLAIWREDGKKSSLVVSDIGLVHVWLHTKGC